MSRHRQSIFGNVHTMEAVPGLIAKGEPILTIVLRTQRTVVNEFKHAEQKGFWPTMDLNIKCEQAFQKISRGSESDQFIQCIGFNAEG